MKPLEKRNAALVVAGESSWGLIYACIAPATVLTVLLQKLGAGTVLIGALTAVEGGLVVFPMFLGNLIAPSGVRRKRFLVLWHIASVTPIMLAMGALTLLTDRIGSAVVRWGLLLGFAAYSFSLGTISSVWLDWMAHLFRKEVRGRVLGMSWGGNYALSAIGALLVGALIHAFPETATYGWLYIVAAIIVPGAMVAFSSIDDHAGRQVDAILRLSLRSLLKRTRQSVADHNSRALLVGWMLALCGFSVVPFFALQYGSPEGGGLSASTIVLCGSALAVGKTIGAVFLGRLGDRSGHRLAVLVDVAVQIATLLLVLTTRGILSCFVAYLGAGICLGGGMISVNNLLFETCPHDSRLAHITIGSFFFSLASIAAPLLGGVASQVWGLPVLFGGSLVLSVAALVWLLVFLKEPRAVAAR
jgi:MFS family permease